jgi:hypothetical protein
MIARLVVLALLVTAACAPITAVSGKVALAPQGLELDMPAGWYRIEPIGQQHLVNAGVPLPALLIDRSIEPALLTRDGIPLQVIRIERLPIDKELSSTKRKLARGMPAHDVAELELDNVRSNPEALNFQHVETTPATVAGRSGFRLVYAWKTKAGLPIRAMHYGFLDDAALYRVVYQAAARHYFERDLATFEQIRQTLRLTAPAPAPTGSPRRG